MCDLFKKRCIFAGMKNFVMKIAFVLIMMYLGTSCGDVVTGVPVSNVNFTVSIYGNKLAQVGGYEYFKGAIAGVFVYRVDLETFCAYDRACPYDYKEDGYVSVDDSNSFQLICGRCHSTFNILNGYPVGNVKAEAPLRSYKAVLIDDINLKVYN